jgi:hypothetical protein
MRPAPARTRGLFSYEKANFLTPNGFIHDIQRDWVSPFIAEPGPQVYLQTKSFPDLLVCAVGEKRIHFFYRRTRGAFR